MTKEQVDEAEMLARDDQKNGEDFRAQRDVLALVAENRRLRGLVEQVAGIEDQPFNERRWADYCEIAIDACREYVREQGGAKAC